MSRANAGDTVIVKPTNNVYTVLLIVSTVTVLLGLVAVFMRAKTLFGENGLFGG